MGILINTFYLNGRSGRKKISEADDAHIINILLKGVRFGAMMQAGQALGFIEHSSARMSTAVCLNASVLQVILKKKAKKVYKNQTTLVYFILGVSYYLAIKLSYLTRYKLIG